MMSAPLAENPLVSIGLPVFNEERYLHLTLKALLAQDYKNVELIISDNGSTDGTADICNEFRNRDNRIEYLRRETNVGAFDNFNGIFELANGKYFMWAGGHDLWETTFASRAVSVLEAEPEVVLVYPRAMLIDAEGKHLSISHDDLDTQGLTPLRRYTKLIWNIESCHMIHGLIRTEALRRSGLFRRVWGSDIVLLADLSLKGVFVQIPEVLFFRREVRPEEGKDLEAWKRRALKTVEGPQPSKRQNMSLEELFREMRNEELRLIWNSKLNYRDKVSALGQTINCSRRRYGVRLPADFLIRGVIAMRTPRGFLRKLRSRMSRAQSA